MTVLHKPVGYIQQTVSSSAAGFSSIPDGALSALIQAYDGEIRWRDDGTAPTASVGQSLNTTEFVYEGNLNAFQMIRAGGSDVEVNVAFYAR